jgi:hypothetical protein
MLSVIILNVIAPFFQSTLTFVKMEHLKVIHYLGRLLALLENIKLT